VVVTVTCSMLILGGGVVLVFVLLLHMDKVYWLDLDVQGGNGGIEEQPFCDRIIEKWGGLRFSSSIYGCVSVYS
jgi:hypothetical protein